MSQFKAAEEGDLTTVRQLVNEGNVDEKNHMGWTVLHKACRGGRVEVVDYLLGLKADVNARDSDECSPLLRAAANSRPQCVKRMIEAGADPSMADTNGNTPCIMLVIRSSA